jgi:amino acid transporter
VRKTSVVTATLASGKLGVPAVFFFLMSGIAPLTVSAGVIPTSYAVTGLVAIPAAFLTTAVVLSVFSVGYVAMARHIQNSGAFYAFVAKGLGRSTGVGAALIALVAYNLLQVGLYGGFGPGLRDYMASNFGVHAPWWLWAGGAWAVVTVLGRLRVDLNSKVLAVLLSVEILVVITLSVSGVAYRTNHHLALSTLDPTKLLVGSIGPALVVTVLGAVGFEGAAIFAEEVRNPKRTVAVATFLSLAVIAVIYCLAAWSMAAHYGVDHVAQVAHDQGPGMFFGLGNELLSNAGQAFYLTSLFGAMVAFHSFVTRYVFALGREGVLPRVLARTGKTNSPWVASLAQSSLGLFVIALYAIKGWDPMTKLFFWLGTTGGFGILVLICLTSVAVIAFFQKNSTSTRNGDRPLRVGPNPITVDVSCESMWQKLIAPGLVSIVLAIMVYSALTHYSGLLGVAPGAAVSRWLPSIFLFAGLIGIGWGQLLRLSWPNVYRAIGLGPDAALVTPTSDARLEPHKHHVDSLKPSSSVPAPQRGQSDANP